MRDSVGSGCTNLVSAIRVVCVYLAVVGYLCVFLDLVQGIPTEGGYRTDVGAQGFFLTVRIAFHGFECHVFDYKGCTY